MKRVAEVMDKEGFVTDTLSLGETKFMVHTHVKYIHVSICGWSLYKVEVPMGT